MERPSLTTRFQLSKRLVSAVYQLHCSSWMYREMSSDHVIFFQGLQTLMWENQSPPLVNLYDLRNPYLDGFKNSRSSVYSLSPSHGYEDPNKLAMFWVRQHAYRHPSYLLHKRFAVGESHRSFHRFRHEYYSLGLILLEVGLRPPLAGFDIIAMTGDKDKTNDCEKTNIAETKTFSLISDERLTDIIQRISSRIYAVKAGDTWENFETEGWPKGLNEIIKSLKGAIRGEQIEDITATPVNLQDRDYHLTTLCNQWGRVYPLELLRQSAIMRAERDLGITMGEKYQKLVLRCLKSDFGLECSSPESTWLQAFNWHVVREIEQCCV
jgi:hypothetical protein